LRALHLLGLMPAAYRFRSPEGAPLMLPGAIPGGDHEILLAFFQQVITAQPLPRAEIDWYTMLLEPSRRYLEDLLGERGSSGVLLVVKVRQHGVDLREVVAHPAIRAFEHVAISNVHPGGATEDLRALLTLTADVRERAEERYNELADRIASLRPDGWQLIADFVQTLQSPIDVLETANALIEAQLEGNPHEEQRNLILRRVLIRLLEWRSAGEFCVLIGLAAKGEEATAELLKEKDASALLPGLRAQGLFRDGRLRQWASFLEKRELWEGLFGTDRRLPTEAQLTEAWARRVRTVVEWVGAGGSFRAGSLSKEHGAIIRELTAVVQSVSEGKLSRAREILTALKRVVEERLLPNDLVGMYWTVRADLELAEGLPERAEPSIVEALRCAERAGESKQTRALMVGILSRALHDQGKHDEAAKARREVERLEQEGEGEAGA
jgi:tetratricopeptide (TPR) repeat protein